LTSFHSLSAPRLASVLGLHAAAQAHHVAAL
jgi:hypothetical protein